MYRMSKMKIVLLVGVGVFTLSLIGWTVFNNSSLFLGEKVEITFQDDLDSDGDGLTDKEENGYGTNPYKIDTDNDRYTDKEEVDVGSDPLRVEDYDLLDEDGDMLTNEDERIYGTDPKNPDTDFDGFYDGEEVASGFSPLEQNLAGLSGERELELVAGTAKKVGLAPEDERRMKGEVLSDTNKNLTEFLTSGQVPEMAIDIPRVADADINITDDLSAETIDNFINKNIEIFLENSPIISYDQLNAYLYSVNYNSTSELDELLEGCETSLEEAKLVEVPNDPEAIEMQKNGMEIVMLIRDNLNNFVGVKRTDVDMYSMFSILNRDQAIHNKGSRVINNMYALAEEYNLDTEAYNLQVFNLPF